jgi:hypothetical protein
MRVDHRLCGKKSPVEKDSGYLLKMTIEALPFVDLGQAAG